MITVPTPASLLEVLWFGIGINLSYAFSKKLDQEVQRTEWFKRRGKFTQWLLRRLLDFLHHWYLGLALVVYFPETPELYWMGWGVFLTDLKDVPRRIRGIHAFFQQKS